MALPLWHEKSCQNSISQQLGHGPGNFALSSCSCCDLPSLLPCKSVPGAAAVLLISAIWWIKNLPNFQLKLNLWWIYPYLVPFQACPLAPIPAACTGWCSLILAFLPGMMGQTPLQSHTLPRLGRAQLRLRVARRVRVCVCETPLTPASWLWLLRG